MHKENILSSSSVEKLKLRKDNQTLEKPKENCEVMNNYFYVPGNIINSTNIDGVCMKSVKFCKEVI